MVHANQKFVQIAESMVFASFVANNTDQKIMNNAPLHSSHDPELELLELQEAVSRLLEKRPQSLGKTVGLLKCKVIDVLESP